MEELGDIFCDNFARIGDLAICLSKNECSRIFKSRAWNINRKRDLPECSRTTGEIINFQRHAPQKIASLDFSYDHFLLWLSMNTPGRLYSCSWLFLFEVLIFIRSWFIIRSSIFILLYSKCRDNISVFDFLRNLLYYADCRQRHCKLHLLKVLAHSRNFF